MNRSLYILHILVAVILISGCTDNSTQITFDAIPDYNDSIITKTLAFNSGLPVLSITIDSSDLYGSGGILTHYKGHGRAYERPIKVAYFENKNRVFNSFAGIRLQGEFRDSTSLENNRGVKLIFRKSYNKPKELKQVLNDNTRRFAIRKNYDFREPLAYLWINKIGGITNKIKPVKLFVNNVDLGIYNITDQVCTDNLIKNDIKFKSFYNYRSDNDLTSKFDYKTFEKKIIYAIDYNQSVKKRLTKIFYNIPDTMCLGQANQTIDLASFTAQIFGIMYFGISDWAQGALIQTEKSNYYWLQNDLDCAFYDCRDELQSKQLWEQDIYDLIIKEYTNQDRTILFDHLINNCDDYRQYFQDFVLNVLNHELDSTYLNITLDSVYNMATIMNDSTRYVFDFEKYQERKSFINNRTAYFIKSINEKFYNSKTTSVAISNTNNLRYCVDSVPKQNSYKGHYFLNNEVTISCEDPHFKCYIINDDTVSTKSTKIATNVSYTIKLL